MAHRGGAALAIGLIAIVGVASCGEDETSFSDKKIVEKLNLTKPDSGGKGYWFDGDAFCEIDHDLLNDSGEIDSAAKDRNNLVIASREGNVGVIGTPPFAPDCKDRVQHKLNRLDPVPKEG
jgi:hypothetical protein